MYICAHEGDINTKRSGMQAFYCVHSAFSKLTGEAKTEKDPSASFAASDGSADDYLSNQ